MLGDGSVFQNRGRISFADPSFSKETGTFLVRATFANPAGTLKPGQFVRVHVLGATRPNAILVPQRAVQQGAKSHFVWVVGKDGKAEQRAVQVGQWSGDDWLIIEGLQVGEQVVVDGGIRVAPGAELKVTQYKPPGETAPGAAATGTAAPTSAGKAAALEKGKGGRHLKRRPLRSRRHPRNHPLHRRNDKGMRRPPAPVCRPGSFRVQLRRSGRCRQTHRCGHCGALKGSSGRIEVTGYADGKGSTARNRTIAQERAQAVRDALVAAGVARERIMLKRPDSVTGSGSDAEARRVEISRAAASVVASCGSNRVSTAA